MLLLSGEWRWCRQVRDGGRLLVERFEVPALLLVAVIRYAHMAEGKEEEFDFAATGGMLLAQLCL